MVLGDDAGHAAAPALAPAGRPRRRPVGRRPATRPRPAAGCASSDGDRRPGRRTPGAPRPAPRAASRRPRGRRPPGEALLDWFGGLAPGAVAVGQGRDRRAVRGAAHRATPGRGGSSKPPASSTGPCPSWRRRSSAAERRSLRARPAGRHALAAGRRLHESFVRLPGPRGARAPRAPGVAAPRRPRRRRRGRRGRGALARQLVKRLDLGAAAEQEVALLVGETRLLVAAAARPDGLTEEAVLPLAAHLGRRERPTRSTSSPSPSTGSTAGTGSGIDDAARAARGPVARTSRDRRCSSSAGRRRPRHGGPPVGRRAGQPARRPSLRAAPGAGGRWPSGRAARAAAARWRHPRSPWSPKADGLRIEVAGRDRPGLLAAVTARPRRGGCSTWSTPIAGRGATAASWSPSPFASARRPDARELGGGDRPRPPRRPRSAPVPDAVVHLRRRRIALVHALHGRGARPARPAPRTRRRRRRAAGADVHAARIATDGGRAVDRFDLTDRQGRKLDARRAGRPTCRVDGRRASLGPVVGVAAQTWHRAETQRARVAKQPFRTVSRKAFPRRRRGCAQETNVGSRRCCRAHHRCSLLATPGVAGAQDGHRGGDARSASR